MAKGPNALALLVGSPKGDSAKKPPMSDDGDDMGGGAEERAIQDFFERGNAGDWKGAKAAFRRAYEMCSMGGGESEPDEDDAEI